MTESQKEKDDYKKAADALRSAIKIVETTAWNELMNMVVSDPWDRLYRAVLRKLRPKAPPIVELWDENPR